MKYTIEYLENGARKWESLEIPRATSASYARGFFMTWLAKNRTKAEAARLVEVDEFGREWLLQAWDYAVAESYLPTLMAARPKASDLGNSFGLQLIEIKEEVEGLQKKIDRLLSDWKQMD